MLQRKRRDSDRRPMPVRSLCYHGMIRGPNDKSTPSFETTSSLSLLTPRWGRRVRVRLPRFGRIRTLRVKAYQLPIVLRNDEKSPVTSESLHHLFQLVETNKHHFISDTSKRLFGYFGQPLLTHITTGVHIAAVVHGTTGSMLVDTVLEILWKPVNVAGGL
jgi:hypothetical protein